MKLTQSIRFTLPITAVGLCLSGSFMRANAADLGTEAAAKQGYGWGLGLVAATQRSPYLGVEKKTFAFPLISYENSYVRAFGNTLDIKLPSLGPVDFAFRTKLGLTEGYKASDSSALDGMSDRKGGVDMGLAATWATPYAKLRGELLGDVSGKSKGYQMKFGVERTFVLGRGFDLTPVLGVTWQDDKYVDYYYGVKAAEATAFRPQYLGKATANAEASLRLGYAVRPNQRVFVEVAATRLGSGITESPIVDKANTAAVRVGYLYRF